jgi:2-methylcitrate dehydratase PrpD
MTAFSFAHELRYADLPPPVVGQALRCILDLAGVAAAGTETELSRIVRDFAVDQMAAGGKPARLMFDGRRVSASGAAFAGASQIDAFDAHDGHALTKGHAGVAILPAVLAVMDAEGGRQAGRELIAAVVAGYEIATRAGIALHRTALDYHTSGAWNAIACAVLTARLLGLDIAKMREAAGIAEYHGPRSQMMRCIDHPTMVKDGSGWGALGGVSAGYLAAAGFTGAPAVLLEDEAVADLWADLGTRWRITEQYFKPYPVCRWAQPAIEAGRALQLGHNVTAEAIARIKVETFAEGVRLAGHAPPTTEAAQYAIAFPLAAILTRGGLGGSDIGGAALADPAILDLSHRIDLVVDDALAARFPAERLARVTFTLHDGRMLASDITPARGDPSAPLSNDEVAAKFGLLTARLGPARQERLRAAVEGLAGQGDVGPLLAAVTEAI